jgi:large subunit ribosomal protein L13
MIIDAKNLIAGRLATYAAKKSLLGEGIVIVNSEAAVMSGAKEHVLKTKKQDFDRGIPSKGPFIPKRPERYLKRIIRGMLPYKQPKGKEAFKRIKCHVGVPSNYKDQKIETIKSADVSKLPNTRYVTIKEICRHLGGKNE